MAATATGSVDPDERPPVGILPQLEVLLRHQLVADDPAGDQPEPRLVAGVDQLLRRGRMEMDHRLRRQDQRAIAALGDRQGPVHRPGRAEIASWGQEGMHSPQLDAVFLDDLDHPRLGRQGNGVGRACADTSQTGDAARRVNGEVQGRSRMGGGRADARCKLARSLRSVKR